MNRLNGTWVTNMCQKLEHMCMDVDHFVCKEPVLFVGNQMETVGKNMKNFFSGFVDTNSVVEIKENTVDSNINNPKDAPSVPKELCHRPSSTGSCHSEQITSEISQYLISENAGFINNTFDHDTQANLSSSTNILNIDHRSEEKGVIYDESLHNDVTSNEYLDWGIENILELDLDIDNMIKGQPLMNLEEKKAFLNGPTDELEFGSNTSTTHQSSEFGSSITRNENQDENAKHIIACLLSSERFNESFIAGSCHSEQITSEISQYLISENAGFINNTFDHDTQANLSSSTNILNIDHRSEEKGVIYDESLHNDVTSNEYLDWGIENILELDLDIDNMIKGQPLMNLEEKKAFLNGPTDELEFGSNTSTTHQSSEFGSSITRNENQDENAKHIIACLLSSERFNESLNSSSQPCTVDHNATETVGCLSMSSDNHSSCESFTTLSFESNNEDHVSCPGSGLVDDSTINFKDFKNDTVESCVIVEGSKLSAFPSTSRSKSYKKMIQDAFLSRKRLTKEYKQLAILYGDIDKELFQPIEGSNKPPAQDLQDSEWELL